MKSYQTHLAPSEIVGHELWWPLLSICFLQDQQLVADAGIGRNRLKIKATITNAQQFMKVQDEFGSFSKYIWGFVNHKPIQNAVKHHKEAPANTSLSDTISKDLKQRGFKFVGSTVIYAHMQATGMVNDHEVNCFRYNEVKL